MTPSFSEQIRQTPMQMSQSTSSMQEANDHSTNAMIIPTPPSDAPSQALSSLCTEHRLSKTHSSPPSEHLSPFSDLSTPKKPSSGNPSSSLPPSALSFRKHLHYLTHRQRDFPTQSPSPAESVEAALLSDPSPAQVGKHLSPPVPNSSPGPSPPKSVRFSEDGDDVSEYNYTGMDIEKLTQKHAKLTKEKAEFNKALCEWNNGISTFETVELQLNQLIHLGRQFDRRLQRLRNVLRVRDDSLNEAAKGWDKEKKAYYEQCFEDYRFPEESNEASQEKTQKKDKLIGCLEKGYQESDENKADMTTLKKIKNDLVEYRYWLEATNPKTIQQILELRRRRRKDEIESGLLSGAFERASLCAEPPSPISSLCAEPPSPMAALPPPALSTPSTVLPPPSQRPLLDAPQKSVHFSPGRDGVSEYDQCMDTIEVVKINRPGENIEMLMQKHHRLAEAKAELIVAMKEWNDKTGPQKSNLFLLQFETEERALLAQRCRFAQGLQYLKKALKVRGDYLDEKGQDLEQHGFMLTDMEKPWTAENKCAAVLDEPSETRLNALRRCRTEWLKELDQNEAEMAKVTEINGLMDGFREWFDGTKPQKIEQMLQSRPQKTQLREKAQAQPSQRRLLTNDENNFTICKEDLFV